MILNSQLVYALATLCLVAFCQQVLAEVSAAPDNVLNNLYENMLQREYAGPVIFPNHQVERKAQRSPSLRLRFGRRSDPDLMPSAEKRWFGDVNQKPIRSPSLRLRFGRRSDPSVPLHSNLDVLMNDLTTVDDNAMEDYNDAYEGYERMIRKPQRLRWGRSVPIAEGGLNAFTDEEIPQNERAQQRQRADDFFNSLMNSDKLRSILLTLRQYEAQNAAASDDDADDGFSREVRKPAPLRLRFGRSTGGRTTVAGQLVTGTEQAQQKKTISENAVTGKDTTAEQDQKKA